MHGTGATNENENNWRNADDPGPPGGPPIGYTMHRLSFLVGILPFVEQQAMWETISNPSVDDEGESWAAMGPSPVTIRYAPWASDIPTYRCPSDPGFGIPSIGRTNYAACTGDSPSRSNIGGARFRGAESAWRYWDETWLVQQVNAAQRGAFVPRKEAKFRDILDGLANTIMSGEIATDLGDNDIRTSPALNNSPNGAALWGAGIQANPSICKDTGLMIRNGRPDGLPPLAPRELLENAAIAGLTFTLFTANAIPSFPQTARFAWHAVIPPMGSYHQAVATREALTF